MDSKQIILFKSPRKILLYIIYGNDQIYYDGAIFSYLTFMHWVSEKDKLETVVLTQKAEKFKNYPLTVIPMSESQKKDWSLNGKYHFRIKNRGLAYVMDKLNLSNQDKVLFFDCKAISNFFNDHFFSPRYFKQPTIERTCCCKKD